MDKKRNKFKEWLKTKTGMDVILSVLLIFVFVSLVRANEVECVDKYSFVNKRFACFEHHVINKKDYRQIRSELIKFIDEQKQLGNVKEVSLFFRDLEAGPTMGINERVDFVPASLLKLPTALILMRLHEEKEIDIYKETSSYTEDNPMNTQYGRVGYEIVPNTSYTIDQLIFRSLVYSDNIANALLVEYISSLDKGRNLFSEIYRDLGIIEVNDSVTSAVNTKGYSTIFRMLYNSSFLSPDSSEKLLNIMSQSSLVGGIRKGVPSDIKVAHKYGERVFGEDHQLHDCGVIYYPRNPYLLCVMTRGKDVFQLQEIIKEVSRRVYEEFDSRRLEG